MSETRAAATVLVTGATGFVGSHFLYRLLLQQRRAVAVVRGESVEAARARLLRRLEDVAASYCEPFARELSDFLEVTLGDMTQPRCGIDLEDHAVRKLSDVQLEVWHFAANVSREECNAAQLVCDNELGTQHVVELAAALHAARFVQVSTAYVAGQMEGDVPAALHSEAPHFNDPYERTKSAAERIVASRCAALGIDWCIVRPSLVLGPTTTKRSGGGEAGLYQLASELDRLRKVLNGLAQALVVEGDPRATLDAVPVDVVVDAMCRLLDGEHGNQRVHHLTNDTGLAFVDVLAMLCDVAGVQTIRVERNHEPESPLEQLLCRRLDAFAPYLRHPKRFVASSATSVRVTLSDLREYMTVALRESSGDVVTALLERDSIVTRDGSVLTTFAGGARNAQSTVVLVNAFGMPAEFMLALARELGSRHRILTWESRGVPAMRSPLTRQNAGLDSHADDLLDVLHKFDVKEAVHVVGWCSGSHVAHRFARRHPQRVRSVSLLNGAFYMPTVDITPFQENVRSIMPRIAQGLEYAELYFDALYGGAGGLEKQHVNALLDGMDASLISLTGLPFRSADRLHRYALLMSEYLRDGEEAHAGKVDRPTLVVAGKCDRVAHHAGAEMFAKQCKQAQTVVFDDGDHYGLLLDSRVAATVSQFVKGLDRN